MFIDTTAADTANDMLLAQMLQLEFDKENDGYVKSLEKTYNGTSKGRQWYYIYFDIFSCLYLL